MDALSERPPVTVLHVEDNDADAYFFKRALKVAKFPGTVLSVCSGEAAIEYLSGQGRYSNRARFPLPSLVLLDLGLPGMHGFDLLKWIRQQTRFQTLPVALLSATARDVDHQAAMVFGVAGFWAKPADSQGFGEIVARITTLLMPPGASPPRSPQLNQ